MARESADDLERIVRERDLFRVLLELGAAQDLKTFLEQVLDVLVDISGARMCYVELTDRQSDADAPRWSLARGCDKDDIEQIRRSFSSGVIAEALASGRTVATASARNDPRFQDHVSVQENRIEAVLCAPLGGPTPMGVVYLQDRMEPGPFTDGDKALLEFVSPHLAALAERLILHERTRTDPTRQLRRELRANGLVGRSAAVAQVLRQVSLLAPLEITVLIVGATGTGKTQLARIIHDNSVRRAHPFVELNCGALPESLIESELFGAHAGAHSTATRRIEGKVATAHGGTLFLDEIGELSLSAQTKLLQLLQSKDYFPLGSPRPIRADVRVIAATNLDLKAAVAEKRFRDDLYYRLNVVSLRMPTLAERVEDIPVLVEHFCGTACAEHRLGALRPSPDAIAAAQGAEWNGNVRELAHAVESAAIRATGEGAQFLRREHLFPDQAPDRQRTSFQESTRTFQSQLLRRTLEETGWNVSETAERLDLARSHVYNLIRAFGLGRL